MNSHKKFNGPALIVGMFRELDPGFRRQLYKNLQEADPLLAKLVDETEFLFQDLIRLDDPSLQALLTQVPEKDWLVAWKLAPEPVKKRLLENMSTDHQIEFVRQFKDLPRMHKAQVYRVQMHISRQALAGILAGKLHMRPRHFKRGSLHNAS